MSTEKATHTPGPWKAVECRHGFTIDQNRHFDIMATQDPEGRYGAIFKKEDALLMAAAPDLLRCLENCLNIISKHVSSPLIGDAEEVVARAKGELNG